MKFQKFSAPNFSLLFNPLTSFSKLKLLLIHVKYSKKRKRPLKEYFIRLYKRIIFIGQMLWFLRIKRRVSKFIDFKEAFISYNELQFLYWSSIVAHSPAGLMFIAYELVILVHINIQVTNLTIGYIQFCQGSEG